MRILLLALLAPLLTPDLAFAHAFGMQFTLPLPVHFYIFGGLLAFVASCAILLFFSKPLSQNIAYGSALANVSLENIRRTSTVATSLLLFFSIYVGFFGPRSFELNPLPNLFWIIFLLFFAYATAIVGGSWRYFDPFRAIAELSAPKTTHRSAPEWLIYAPSTLLLALLWLELFSRGAGGIPSVVAFLLLAYTILTIAMSRLYGTEEWFSKGDVFTNFFSIFSKAAPIQLDERSIELMPPGERAVHDSAPNEGVLLFICILLGSTILDGLRETMFWWQLGYAIHPDPRFVGYMSLVALFVIPYLLLLFYLLATWQMKLLTKTQLSTKHLSLRFVYSLAPIAIAYHFAHYFGLILSQGQIFIAQISDPLDKGWNIFGTAEYMANPGIIAADTVWYIQLAVIIGGHILAAVVAHRISRRIFSSTRQVVVSQLPMLVLMVFFTAFGLWTLAQPFLI